MTGQLSLPLGTARGNQCGEWQISLIEDTHRYVVRRASDGAPVDTAGLVSVTTFAEALFPEFGGSAVASRMNPSIKAAKYGTLTNDQILALWEHKKRRAAALGTAMHAYIEAYLRGWMSGAGWDNPPEVPPPSPDEPGSSGVIVEPDVFAAFVKTLEERCLEPAAVETCLYDHELRLAGTADAVFRQKGTGAYWLLDWKRRPDYTTSSPYGRGKTGTPAQDLACCHSDKARLQLNLYRSLMKRAGMFDIGKMAIVTIHPDLPGGFREDEVSVDEGLLARLVEWRLAELRGSRR